MPTISNAHHHTRSSPPHVRKTAAKAARSAPASKAVVAPRLTVRVAKAIKKANEEDEETFDNDEDDMGSSFLQFCAMCEKQIVVPTSSILYCSESCRRRDAVTPNAHPYVCLLNSPTDMGPSTFGEDLDDTIGSKLPTYVPRLQPTPRTAPDGRIPAKFHEGKSDLDPSEWKPAEPSTVEGNSLTNSGEWRPKMAHRPSSEATSYLSKFHRSSDSLTSRRRPMIGHSRTTVSSRSTPALSHTASTSSEESLAGTPYEFVARPALSTQAASSAKASVGGSSDFTYEKKQLGTSMASASGSLKRLLGTADAAI